MLACPGHPLLDAALDLTLERHRDLLRRGTVLVDERDPSMNSRVLFFLEHAIQDASLLPSGERRTISRRMLYVEMDAEGHSRLLHYAPYLDYRPLAEGEPAVAILLARPECAWITRTLEQKAQSHAIAHIVPEHSAEVRGRRLAWIEKTRAAVKVRLIKEITYWDHRAEQLKLQEQAGRAGARLNSHEARRRADDLQARLHRRLAELDREVQALGAATGGAGRARGHTTGARRCHDRPRALRTHESRRPPGFSRPHPRHRNGGRARPGLRPHRPRIREARLRYREPRPAEWSEGRGAAVGPVRRSHPAVVALDDRPVRAVVDRAGSLGDTELGRWRSLHWPG
jgi:hypothetical protein